MTVPRSPRAAAADPLTDRTRRGLLGSLGRARRAVGRQVGQAWAGAPDAADDPRVLLDGDFLRRIEALRLHAPRAATSGLAGEHASRRKAHSVEFADYRAYVPGDDFRLIDWNVYARLGELCLKMTEAHESIAVHLLLDCSASMDWGNPNKLLYARRIAAALGAVALSGYDTVTLGAFGDGLQAVFPPLRGHGAVATLLDNLRGVTPAPATDLPRAAAAYCGTGVRHGIAVLLTDFLVPDGVDEALGYLRRAGLYTTALHIVDNQEEHPRLDGLLELHDCETDDLVRVATTPRLLRRYEEHFATWSADLAGQCAGRGARYLRVNTAVPPPVLVLEALRREGVLR